MNLIKFCLPTLYVIQDKDLTLTVLVQICNKNLNVGIKNLGYVYSVNGNKDVQVLVAFMARYNN